MTAEPIDATESTDPQWYKRAVVYELLVRGFADSNADGTGDLRGMIGKLDYLAWLGVDCLWLWAQPRIRWPSSRSREHDLSGAICLRAVTRDEYLRGVVPSEVPAAVVLNAAGWTDVDGAETQKDEARAVNGDAMTHLAAACRDVGAALIHVSTDYVFGATAPDRSRAERASAYAEDAPTAPINTYGRTKLAGERAVLELCPDNGYVLRTAWLYGRHGRNFVATILGLAATHETVDVVDDQVGQPTWARDLAGLMVDIGHRRPTAGVYHATAAGETSWCGLARAAYEEAGLDPDRVRPLTTADFPRPAARPARSVLGEVRLAEAGLTPMQHWRDMLRRAFHAGTFETAAD